MSETGTLVHFDKLTPTDITKYTKYPANQSLIFQIQNKINKHVSNRLQQKHMFLASERSWGKVGVDYVLSISK